MTGEQLSAIGTQSEANGKWRCPPGAEVEAFTLGL